MPKNRSTFLYVLGLVLAFHWAVPLFAESMDEEPSNQDKSLQVKNIRVGMKDGATRIVLDLTASTQFTIEQSMAGDKLIIKPKEPIEWNSIKQSAQSEGVVQNFRVIGNGQDAYLEVQTDSDVGVQRSAIEDPNSNSPKYVIDLLPNNLGVGNINQMFSNVGSLGVVEQPVTSIGFEIKDGDTLITIHLSKAQELRVIDNIYTHQVIISLPKVDWNKVVVPLSVTGLIKDYMVDQSAPDRTNLVLNIDRAAGVIGKNLSMGGAAQGANFTVALSTSNAKVPAWLSEVTAENLPYNDANKKDGSLGTRAMRYRGGALEYANIGEGFYLTALGGQLAGSNTVNSSTAAGTSSNIASSLMGASSYVGMGYGLQIERNYFGLEGLLGYQTLFSKSEYTNSAGAVTKLKNTMGLNWLVAGRAGYYTSPTSLLYGKIGVASSTFTMDGSGSDNTIIYNTKKQILRSGFLFGVGIEAAIDDRFTARIETNQTNYQPFKVSSGGIKGKSHPRVQEMLIGLSWKPSPMGGPVASDVYEDTISTGLYMGGEAGLGSMTNTRTVTGTSSNKYKATDISPEPVWSLYGGYSYNIGRYYVAGEGQIGFNQSNISESRTNAAGQTESLDNFLRWSLALTGRFGYIFNHGVLGYGRVGIVTSRFSTDGRNNTGDDILAAQKKSAKTLTGLRIGGGLEVFLQPSLSLRGDYTMDLYPAAYIKGDKGSSEKVLATRNEFKLGLAYTFPVHK